LIAGEACTGGREPAISATATSPSGDPSEFAACVLVEDVVTDRIFQDSFE